MEQEEYEKEEINWSYIEFVDNQDVLDLIEKVCNQWVDSLFIDWFFSFCWKEVYLCNLSCDAMICY